MKKCSVSIASGVVVLGLLSGCSLVPDHGLDYQHSESSDVELKLPQGSLPARDKLAIPNEERIADLDASGEFKAPRAPLMFEPLAYAPLRIAGTETIMALPVSVAQARTLMSDYIAKMAKQYETDIELEVTDDRLTTSTFELDKKSGFGKLWGAMTGADSAQYRIDVSFEDKGVMTQARLHVLAMNDEKRPAVNFDQNDRMASMMVDMWSSFTSEIKVSRVLLSDQMNKRPIQENSPIWMRSNGQLALNLGERFSEKNFAAYVSHTDGVFLTDDDPRELSLVPQDKVAKADDADAQWNVRSYPYRIVRQQESYFLTVDTSATDYPKLTSYRIFSRLAK